MKGLARMDFSGNGGEGGKIYRGLVHSLHGHDMLMLRTVVIKHTRYNHIFIPLLTNMYKLNVSSFTP